MKLINKLELKAEILPGRIIKQCVGKKAFSNSSKMTMGFVKYCEEAGLMEPHQHAEEIVYIISADSALIRYGSKKKNLMRKLLLKPE